MKPNLKKLLTLALCTSAFALANIAKADVLTVADLPTPFNDAISVDKKGNLFVSNAGNFGPNGLQGSQIYSTAEGAVDGIWLENLDGPLGNTFDNNENFYVSNMNSGAIYKRSKNGEVTLFSSITSGGGMAFDKGNGLYVASYQGGVIYKLDRDGNATVFSDDPRLSGGPVGISFDKNHNLYVGNYDDGKLLKISKDGTVTEITTLAQGGNHIAYLVYAGGHIYTTSLFTNKIYKVTLDGEVTEFAGSGNFGHKDGPNFEADLALPNGITTNKAQDTLYISEYYSSYVKAIRIKHAEK
jgi:sugar lactone lactonase YvrE